MSDPVKNAEVEDVLSSIRRLVSEDKRPLQTPSPKPSSDRLVLTPALRVEDVTPAAEPSKPAAQTETSEKSDQRPVQDPADDYADDPYLFDDPDDPDGEDVFVLGAQDMATKAEEPLQDAAEIVTLPETDSVELSAKIAALETAIGDISDEWEPDGNSSDDYAGTEPSGMTWEDELDDLPERRETLSDVQDVALSERTEAIRDAIAADAVDVASEPVEEIGQAFEIETTSAPSGPRAEAKNMAFESVRTEQVTPAEEIEDLTFEEVTPEPEAAKTEVAEPVATAMTAPQEAPSIEEALAEKPAAQDPILPEDLGESAGSQEDHQQPEKDDFEFAADDQTLDETALREMISDIVQAELQGALGERITRNVRRLVRREIHRALTARDLD